MKLKQVENLHIPRCLQPPSFWRITDTSIIHLSDALEHGYGQCSYMRYVDEDGLIQCGLLLRKSRVSPKKFISIPRLELKKAVLSIKVTCLLRKELQIDSLKLTDGQVVLAYIWSNYKQFKVFVANHIHQIKKMQGLISSTMPQAMKILLMMLHKDLIQERKHPIVIGFMGCHSYGKWKHVGQTKIAT